MKANKIHKTTYYILIKATLLPVRWKKIVLKKIIPESTKKSINDHFR